MKRLVPSMCALLLSGLAVTVPPSTAAACGCFSSPQLPTPGQYAVNQQAEQIIFEVDSEAGTVTAQVLIQYAGAPESFAWILPVPAVPTLGLGEALSFALLDSMTSPSEVQAVTDLCPQQQYFCRHHSACPSRPGDGGVDASFDAEPADASAADAGSGPPVMVIGREVVGSYDTVVFSAGDAAAAVAWLNSEGFIVNDTMTPFMQPYSDAGMIFVAAKLIPDADVDTLRPLSLTYAGTTPMVPLRLTAVGAEPELTVTTYIYGDQPYVPVDQPIVVLDAPLTFDRRGRSSYPMLLARTIDEAGGAAFVSEYRGVTPSREDIVRGATGAGSVCCVEGDPCGVSDDGACQCPSEAWEATDCGDGAVTAVDILAGLAERNTVLSRLTTRLSPHEMTFDPAFAPSDATSHGRLSLTGTQSSLAGCTSDIIDDDRFFELNEQIDCATTYCGAGACVVTYFAGVGCDCDAGFAARQFTDLDGLTSITCVPEASPVDLSAGGVVLQSSCGGTDCGAGRCVDQGGFPACVCDEGAAATAGEGAPSCLGVRFASEDPGGFDRSAELASVRVCMARPPGCLGGWLVQVPVSIPGETCGRLPRSGLLVRPPEPDCSLPDSGLFDDGGADGSADGAVDAGSGGSGGCTLARGSTSTAPALLLFVGLAILARRSRRR